MKNYLTFNQLDSMVMHQAGISDSDIVPDVRQAYINDKLMKIYRFVDGLNDPWYNRTATLTVAADVSFYVERNSVSIPTGATAVMDSISVNQDGEVECEAAGVTFVAGSLVNIVMTDVDGLWSKVCLVRITIGSTGGFTGTIVTGSFFAAGFSTLFSEGDYKICISVVKSLSVTVFDISSMYVKNVVRIFDDQDTGNKPRIFRKVTDANVFATIHRDPFVQKEISWYHRGDTLEFFKGSGVTTAIGTVTMEYRGKPNLFTDASGNTTIDIPPEDNQMLQDEVLAVFLAHVGKSPSADVTERLENYRKMYEAAAAEVEKVVGGR